MASNLDKKSLNVIISSSSKTSTTYGRAGGAVLLQA